jgi:hypothetical protein
MANPNDYVRFIFTSPSNRSYGFKTYTNAHGEEVGFLVGRSKDGTPIYHRWKWDQDGARTLSVHKAKTDVSAEKLNAVEFLRNCPNCKGSPMGAYGHDGVQLDYYFAEVNDEKTAQEALDSEMEKLEAQNIAMKVKGQEYVDLCALIGLFNKEDAIMRYGLVDFARTTPVKFMEMYNDPIRQIKSLIRRGISSKVIEKRGEMLTWEKTLLGVNEEDAVAKLKMDDQLYKALKVNVDKTK